MQLYLVISVLVIVWSVGILFYRTENDAESSLRVLQGNLRVMSWNLRGSDLDDGSTTKWSVRKNVAEKILQNIQPDIVGTQEAQPNQHKLFHEHGMSNYGSIVYQKDKLRILQSATISFSPSGAPVRAWDASSPRGADWVLFQSTTEDKKLIFINLHLDHVGYQSRLESISILARLIEDLSEKFENIPLLITGDFNSVKYSKVWDSLIEGTRLKDVSLVLSHQDSIEFTYHHFHGLHFNSIYMRPVQYISYAVSCTEIGRRITKIPSCFAPSIWRSIKEGIFGQGKVHHIDWMLYNALTPRNFFVVTDHEKVSNPKLASRWHPKAIIHRNIVNSYIYASDHFPVAASYDW